MQSQLVIIGLVVGGMLQLLIMVKYTHQICAKVFEVDHLNIHLYLQIISVIIYSNYLEYGKYG